MKLAIGFGSSFLNQYRTIMVRPDFDSSYSGDMILSAGPNHGPYCSSVISYLPVTTEGHIEVDSVRLMIDDDELQTSEIVEIILNVDDSRTSVLSAWFDPIMTELNSATNNSTTWNEEEHIIHIPNEFCAPNTISQLPTFRFRMGDVDLVLYPEDYAYQHRSYCTAGIAFDYEDKIIFGNSLIGKIAYIFDADEQRVGFCDP